MFNKEALFNRTILACHSDRFHGLSTKPAMRKAYIFKIKRKGSSTKYELARVRKDRIIAKLCAGGHEGR